MAKTIFFQSIYGSKDEHSNLIFHVYIHVNTKKTCSQKQGGRNEKIAVIQFLKYILVKCQKSH